MSEEGYTPLFSPPLKRHRLVRLTDANQDLTIGSSFPDAAPPAPLLAAQAKLAEEAARLVQEMIPGLEALQTALAAQDAAEKTAETLQLVCSALRVLPGELASGAAASVARVDWIFSRLLNAPGQPGLIEQAMLELTEHPAKGAGENPARAPELAADDAAVQELLRRLHRDLVTLQQGWEDMLELTLPPELFEPILPVALPPADEAPAVSGEAQAASPRMAPTPLPSGLVVAHSAARWHASAQAIHARRRVLSSNAPLVAMVLIVLVLVLTGGGVYMLQNLRGQPVNPNNAAVIAPLPSPTATATTQPTVAPTATATATATSTPRPRPTATHTPAPTATTNPPVGPLCASGANLCASISALQVPCSGQAGVTFQLTNSGNGTITWMPISSIINGTTLVSASPTGGNLKAGRQVTVTVSAHARGQGMIGTLTIMAGFENDQMLVITLQVC